MNLFLPKLPRGAFFVALSGAGCKVGRRIRQRGFLVRCTTSLLSPRISAGSVPMLGLGVCLAQCCVHPVFPGQIVVVGVRDRSKMVECLGSETSVAAPLVRQPAVQTCNDLHQRPAKIGHFLGPDSPSLVSCLAHLTGLLARTTSSSLTSVPNGLRVTVLTKISCAYSRRPHIQLHGSDLSGR